MYIDLAQLDLFKASVGSEYPPGWFFWEPPFALKTETLNLYTSIIGGHNYEFAEFETSEAGDYLVKMFISKEGMERIDSWIAERKSSSGQRD